MDGGEEVAGGLVVARGHGTELLEFGKEILDEVTRLVDVLVVVAGQSAISTVVSPRQETVMQDNLRPRLASVTVNGRLTAANMPSLAA